MLQELRNELLKLKEEGGEISECELLAFCMKETMRMIGFEIFLRHVEEDMEYNGYIIPKNSKVVCSSVSVHYDEKVFPEPLTWNPKRWKNVPSSHFVAFGGGVHKCKGEVTLFPAFTPLL